MTEVIIEADKLGKEYNYQTIFHQLSHKIDRPHSLAVLGENGSGKSTLLRVLSGMAEATHGRVNWMMDGVKLPAHQWYKFLSFCSPDFHFDSRFTVTETIIQYHTVKPLQKRFTAEHLIDLMGFQTHRRKQMNELSSGMNQRVRLALAVCAAVPVLFLDEPCSNLDQQGVFWYNELIEKFAAEKLVFVASNDPREYEFCDDRLSLMDYK